jgi:hypothetical protein
MSKKDLVVKRLIDKLTEEKNKVNDSLINKEYNNLAEFQRRAFLTGKALRKILKLNG